MKNIFFPAVVALVISSSINAQTDTTTKPTINKPMTTVDSIAANYKLLPMPEPLTVEKTFPVLGTYQLNNSTDAAVTNANTQITDANSATVIAPGTITVSLDPANKGIIWVEGLPQGKVKAYLKKSPATYRILAQKTQAGTQVQEGTLHFDPTTNQLNIALGKAFDDADPMAIFSLNPANTMTTEANPMVTGDVETKVKTEEKTVKTEVEGNNKVKVKTKTPTSKSKAKVTYYTAVKLDKTSTAGMQNQQ
ncbi:MAG: hypothetical protein ABR503_10360 [Chitinophagaceae bacterium]